MLKLFKAEPSMMPMFVSSIGKMLMEGDSDLKLVQSSGSAANGFKHTMLDQDAVFRKQVHDLHQMYRMQKTLMNVDVLEEVDALNSYKYAAQSSLTPFMSSSSLKPLGQAQVPLFPTAHGTKQPMSYEMPNCHLSMYSTPQLGPLDLQFSADQYLSHFEDNHVDLKLSLNVGGSNQRRGTKRAWFDKKTHIFPIAVIDLEDSPPRISSCSKPVVIDLEASPERPSVEDAKFGPYMDCSAPVSYFGENREAQVSVASVPIISCSARKDRSLVSTESSSLLDHKEIYQKQNFHGDLFASKNLFTKKQRVISVDGEPLDLNKVMPDDSSSFIAYPSTASSADGFKEVGRIQEGFLSMFASKEKVDIYLNDVSGTSPQEDSVCISGTNEYANISRNVKLYEASVMGSVSQSLLVLCEDFGSTCVEPKKEKDKLTSKLHEGFIIGSGSTSVAIAEGSYEKSVVEDTKGLCSDSSQNAVTNEGGDKSPVSCKSRCISDDDSSSIKTMQSGTDLGNSNTPASHKFSRAKMVQGEKGNRLKSQFPDNKEESVQVDDLIQGAAESLIHISLNNTPCNWDCLTKEGSSGLENEKMDQPQNSIDSYELIAMNLTESNEDDYCVSSKPFEVNESEKQDYSCKLRRGRRMKDFQKDILPGLACLSRHEIREDVNIMEGVLRSREYRKMRAMNGDGPSWCAPTKNKRTRAGARRKNSKEVPS